MMQILRMPRLRFFVTLSLFSLTAAQLLAVDFNQYRIPDEYEATPGHGLALSNAGVAAVGGLSAVRINPAMIALERQYSVSGGFHWPTRGREFFNVGVVDSKSSSIAAAVSYTTFADDYYTLSNNSAENQQNYDRFDSPVVRRGNIALAQSFKLLAFGLSGQYVEGHPLGVIGDQRLRGTSLGMGAAMMIMPQLRAGASVENLGNRKIADFAPRTYRAGAAYLLSGGNISFHLDYQNRERVIPFEGPQPGSSVFAARGSDVNSEAPTAPNEQMLIASGSARVQDMIRLFAGYGQGLTDDRKSLSGGVGLVSEAFALTYAASRPYLSEPESQNAISISVNVSM